MLIETPNPDATRLKDVKVRIPLEHHLKLHSLKVLTGKQISEVVSDALTAYFAAAHAGAADS